MFVRTSINLIVIVFCVMFYLKLTSDGGLFFTLISDGGVVGVVEYVHPILICENNRKVNFWEFIWEFTEMFNCLVSPRPSS